MSKFEILPLDRTRPIAQPAGPASPDIPAHIAAASGAEADIAYTLDKVENGDTRYRLMSMTQTRPPNGGGGSGDRAPAGGQSGGETPAE